MPATDPRGPGPQTPEVGQKGKNRVPETVQSRSREVAWNFRHVFGNNIQDCKEGFAYYEVDLGHTMEGLSKPRYMNQGPIKKAALRRYLEIYEQAGVVSQTQNEAYSNAFLVKKPGYVPNNQEQMDDAIFSKQWRLFLDLFTVDRSRMRRHCLENVASSICSWSWGTCPGFFTRKALEYASF